MLGIDEELTTRSGEARPGSSATFVYGASTRAGVSIGIVVIGVATVGLAALVDDDHDGYVLAHAMASAPFVVGALVCAAGARRSGAPQFRVFWQRWLQANTLASGATLAAIGAVVFESSALLVLDMVLMLAAVPFWVSASLFMLAAQAGRRDASVDVVDGAMAIIVLGAPGVLLLAGPMLETTELVFAGPFALFLLLTPASLYGSCLNVARSPRGERVTQGLGVALAGAFVVNVAMQLAQVLGNLDLPIPVFVAFHALNMALVMALPLWAHRVTSGGLGRLPVEHQLRRSNPMPAISAVVLPVLAIYVLTARADDPWVVGYLATVLLAVIVLNALRHSMLSREAQRLSSELAQMAEERRQLLASMVRALEDDRRRTVSELHTQAVGSLSTLGTVVQTACVSLPPATASVVRETIRQLQGDLSDRAEELRMLMVAMRPPSFDDTGHAARVGDDALSAALRAYASELHGDTIGDVAPGVQIVVDPRLDLDRSTMTIVYRIAQEALRNAVRHARATLVVVEVGVQEGRGAVFVEVSDDGIGFDRRTVADGTGLSSMQLFTDLGRGELTVRSAPGEGTVVRSMLGVRDVTPSQRPGSGGGIPRHDATAPDVMPSPGRRDRRHLRLIPPVEAAPGP